MEHAQGYYDSLLESGYNADAAYANTKGHFPEFSLDTGGFQDTEVVDSVMEDVNTDGRLKYIPVAKSKIKDRLLSTWQMEESKKESLSNVFRMFEAIWHHDFHSKMEEMKEQYAPMDPDSNEIISYSNENVMNFIQTFEETLVNGNWEPVTDEEISQALEAEDVLPISLDVRFDEYKNQRYYKLGQHVEQRVIQTLSLIHI